MIYTSVFGKRDRMRSDITCFATPLGFDVPRMNAKAYKVLSHLFVHEDSVWLDGNIYPRTTEDKMLDKLLGEYDLTAFKHPWRNTAKEEADELLKMGHITHFQHETLLLAFPQIAKLKLYECGILFRRYNDRVKRFNEEWWRLINMWPPRDQITFALAMERTPDLKVNQIDATVRNHKYFDFRGHGH